MSIYGKTFGDCAKNGLRFFECPQALFSIMGGFTITTMLLAYYFTSRYASPEFVVISTVLITLVMLVIGQLVSESVRKINAARRQAEEEKRKTEAIVANLADGLMMFSPKKEILFINPKACQMLGIDNHGDGFLPEKLRGKNMEHEFPNLKPLFRWQLDDESFSRQKTILEKISLENPKRHLKVFTVPVVNPAGTVLGFVKTLHDVTREKEIDQLKSEFISLASHQLRGPLSSIKWLLELLRTEKVGKVETAQKKLLEEMNSSNERMIRIVSELLDVARIEEQRMELKKKNEDVTTILANAVRDAEPQARKKKIALKFVKPASIFANLDLEKMRFVFQNLVENAIKYTRDNGAVEIKIVETGAQGIKEKYASFVLSLGKKYVAREANGNKFCVVSVHDNGIGISEEDKRKIFSKFYRGQRAKEVEAQGTGLGLFICRQIVEKHEGFIWFTDGENLGTTFFVAVPID